MKRVREAIGRHGRCPRLSWNLISRSTLKFQTWSQETSSFGVATTPQPRHIGHGLSWLLAIISFSSDCGEASCHKTHRIETSGSSVRNACKRNSFPVRNRNDWPTSLSRLVRAHCTSQPDLLNGVGVSKNVATFIPRLKDKINMLYSRYSGNNARL